MKFNPGDPVWVRSEGDHCPRGELAGVISSFFGKRPTSRYAGDQHWRVQIAGVPCPYNDAGWVVPETLIRPRRDDYQQHEPRTTMRDVRDSLRDNLPVKETVDES